MIGVLTILGHSVEGRAKLIRARMAGAERGRQPPAGRPLGALRKGAAGLIHAECEPPDDACGERMADGEVLVGPPEPVEPYRTPCGTGARGWVLGHVREAPIAASSFQKDDRATRNTTYMDYNTSRWLFDWIFGRLRDCLIGCSVG